MADHIQFRISGEWTMVYLNGQLVESGDHYHADEWLQERCGVEVVQDDAGICIPDGHNPIRTLAEVEQLEAAAARRKREADEKRAQAQQLLAEANELEGKR
jgi:hypothetical protein